MKPLQSKQIITMLYLQHQLNTVIDPLWYTKDQDFQLAILVEAGEFADHCGWPWWKKQEPNIPQAQIELIDIWHFTMAIVSRSVLQQMPELITSDEEGWHSHPVVQNLAVNIEYSASYSGDPDYDNSTDSLDITLAIGHVKRFVGIMLMEDELHITDIIAAMELVEVADLFRAFVAKNCLNIFRQSRGYKAGTYQKLWHGEEDNVVLHRIMADWDEEKGIGFIMSGLDTRYQDVIDANHSH